MLSLQVLPRSPHVDVHEMDARATFQTGAGGDTGGGGDNGCGDVGDGGGDGGVNGGGEDEEDAWDSATEPPMARTPPALIRMLPPGSTVTVLVVDVLVVDVLAVVSGGGDSGGDSGGSGGGESGGGGDGGGDEGDGDSGGVHDWQHSVARVPLCPAKEIAAQSVYVPPCDSKRLMSWSQLL